MSDQPTPAPGDQPDDSNKSKRSRADIRKDYLDELTRASEVAAVAQKPDYAPKLLEEAVQAADVTALVKLIEDTRRQIAAAGSTTSGKKSTTKSEAELKGSLVLLTDKIQSRAKRVYGLGDPRRADYHVGKVIDSNRAQLEQASASLLEHAAADTKLNIGAELLAKLKAARDAYVAVQTEQTGKKTAAKTTRESVATMIKAVAKARRDIQYAADAAWPAAEKVHGAIRNEFKIPPDRKLR